MKKIFKELLNKKRIYLDFTDKKNKEKVVEDLKLTNYLSEISEAPNSSEIIITDKPETSGKNIISVIPVKLNIDFFKTLALNIHKSILFKNMLYIVPEEYTMKEVNKVVLSLFILISLVQIILIPFIPKDDLLRHLVAHKINFDYSNIFINTDLPKWDFHFTYDFIAGIIYQVFQYFPFHHLNEYGPIIFIQTIIFLCFLYAVRLNTKDLSVPTYVFLTSLILWIVFERLLLGRPTTLSLVLFLASIGFLKNKKETMALVSMTILSVMYYLFFIYLFPLIFFYRKTIFPIIAGTVFWGIYAFIQGGNYFSDVFHYVLTLSTSGIKASENYSIINFIGKPILVFALVLIIVYFNKIRKEYFYTSLYFYLSNQVRYLEVISPLTLISISPLISTFTKKVLKGNPILLVILSISILIGTFPRNSESLPNKNLCEEIRNSKIKTTLEGNFRLMYSCIDYGIKINPAMEIRWSNDLEIDKKLIKGKISCSSPALHKYDFLYEKSLKQKYPCLKIKNIDGKYRLWKIQKSF